MNQGKVLTRSLTEGQKVWFPCYIRLTLSVGGRLLTPRKAESEAFLCCLQKDKQLRCREQGQTNVTIPLDFFSQNLATQKETLQWLLRLSHTSINVSQDSLRCFSLSYLHIFRENMCHKTVCVSSSDSRFYSYLRTKKFLVNKKILYNKVYKLMFINKHINVCKLVNINMSLNVSKCYNKN